MTPKAQALARIRSTMEKAEERFGSHLLPTWPTSDMLRSDGWDEAFCDAIAACSPQNLRDAFDARAVEAYEALALTRSPDDLDEIAYKASEVEVRATLHTMARVYRQLIVELEG